MANIAETSLPIQTTTLIGRGKQIDEILSLLQDAKCRLLTLIGPGGIGKTQLAIAAASQWRATGREAGAQEMVVVYVALQAVSSPQVLPSAIADAAGLTLAGPEPLPIQLVNHLRGKQLRLVLDNFEHLLAGSNLLADILREAPAVKLLVTSREALSLREEWLYSVSGLPVPAPDNEDTAAGYPGVQLFGERARQVRHDFRLEDEIAPVISICRMAEGMPLAIELAASWLSVLNCAAIVERLQQNLDILVTSLRNVPERHQSIRAAFDSSWQMLRTEECDVFMQLAVFQGGFTLSAAAEVAGATLPILSALVAKSLVRREPDGRYQIHELLRQYAGEKLAESPEAEAAVQHAHSRFFMQFLAEKDPLFRDARQRQAVQEIADDLENVRKAWQWAVNHLDSKMLRMAGSSLVYLCQFQSRYLEGAEFFLKAVRCLESDQMTTERSIALAETLVRHAWFCIRLGRLDDADSALTRSQQLYVDVDISSIPNLENLYSASMFAALVRGNYKQAITLGTQALSVVGERGYDAIIVHYGVASAALAQGNSRLAKTHAIQGLESAIFFGDQRNTTFLHSILGKIALEDGDLHTAKGHFETAYRIHEALAEPGGMAEHLANLADVARLRQEWPEAIRLFRRSHSLYQEIGDQGAIARAQLGLGIVAQSTDERGSARAHYRSALDIAVKVQGTPLVLSVLAAVGDFWLSDNTVAARHASNEATMHALGQRILACVLQHPGCNAQIKRRILDTLARSGISTPEVKPDSDCLDKLVVIAQTELAAPYDDTVSNQPLTEPLTAREREVLRLLAAGRTNPEIAEELIVAVGTIKAHASRIYRKLDVAGRTQAVLRARELGLLV